MKLRCALAFAMLIDLVAMPLCAAELTPRVDGAQLGISISGVSYPETLARDLRSGLENRILIQVAVVTQSRVVAHADITIAVKYDLWEEKFKLKKTGGKVEEREFKEAADVIAYLSVPPLTQLFSLDALPQAESCVAKAEILINPIEREKMERLRQWVADNSTPGGVVRAGMAPTPLTSMPNDLFNKIFEQYVRGANIIAPWRLGVTSKPFLTHDLRATQ